MARIDCTYSRIRGTGGTTSVLHRRVRWDFVWLPKPSWNRPFDSDWIDQAS